MIYECVNFNDEAVKAMSRDEFVKAHIDHFWTKRDEATREKMLTEVYNLINPAKKSKAKKAEQ